MVGKPQSDHVTSRGPDWSRTGLGHDRGRAGAGRLGHGCVPVCWALAENDRLARCLLSPFPEVELSCSIIT